jgi:hypothetical protein
MKKPGKPRSADGSQRLTTKVSVSYCKHIYHVGEKVAKGFTVFSPLENTGRGEGVTVDSLRPAGNSPRREYESQIRGTRDYPHCIHPLTESRDEISLTDRKGIL